MGLLNRGVAAVWNVLHPQASAPSPSDDFWYQDIGSLTANHAGVRVTPDIALKAADIFAVVDVLANIIATMPLAMYRENEDGGRTPVPFHPLDELIRFQPNAIQTAADFWATMVFHAALRGNAYAEIIPGPRGAVDQLIPLHPNRVTPESLPDRSLRFKVTDPRTGQTRTLLQEEMFRFGGMSSDGVRGLSPVDLAAEDIALGLAADAYASRVFSNNLNIGGYLKHPRKLSSEALQNLLKAFMERVSGVRNAHRPIVLQEGMEFITGSMVAKDAQLLEARKWQVTLIAMRWRIPLFMLGLEQGGADSEQQAGDFVKYSLRPWVKRIEQAIRRDLIIAKSTFVAKFNMDALLRGSTTSMADMSAKVLGSGGSPASWTQNEVRTKIWGLNPIDDPRADILGVGTNPRTDEPMALAASVPRQIEDDTPKGRAERLVRKEVAAVRKAAIRFADDPDAFRKWTTAFFGGHVSDTMKALGIEKDEARAYCALVRDKVLAADDVEGLLDRWEASGADEIAKTLLSRGGEDGKDEQVA